MEGSLDILSRVGLLSKIEPLCEDLKTLSILDGNADLSEKLDFRSFEIGLDRFGKNVPNDLLQAFAFEKFMSLKNATLIQERAIEFSHGQSLVEVTLKGGETVSCRLLIGADGRNSPVRQFAGIETTEHDYDQMALTGVIQHERAHSQASTEFHYPGGPFTIVPMTGNNSSFVWMEKTEDAKKMRASSKKDIEAILNQRSKGLVGTISLSSELSAYPVKVQKSKRLVSSRIALIAEAAHVLSPIGAQGLNLSLRDAASLSDVIVKAARSGIDFGSEVALLPYEKERFIDISVRVSGTDFLNRSVATENSAFRALRKFSLKTAAKISPLKKLLIRQAWAPKTSFTQEILSGLETRATVKASTCAAPAS